MQAVLVAFVLFAPFWRGMHLVIYTDNATTFTGLKKHQLKSPSNIYLRHILLLAAENDVRIEPVWLPGATNNLADALSRFDFVTSANLCSSLQSFSPSPNPLANGSTKLALIYPQSAPTSSGMA